MKELYWLLGIKIGASTAYHPQTNGQTKWVNQELEQFIWLFVNECQDNWNSLLLLAKFAYNNHVHSSTQQTPANTLRWGLNLTNPNLEQKL